MDSVTFININSAHLQDCFLKAFEKYTRLHNYEILVVQKPITGTNMRAQPVIDFRFWSASRRRFKIEISNHDRLTEHLRMEDLPEEVLTGWLAHELGHIMDYLDRSALNLLYYGLGYVLFPTFRIGVERKADLYAIQHGYADYIMHTKKFILEHSSLPNSYKKRIEKYYMSPEEVAILLDKPTDGVSMDTLL